MERMAETNREHYCWVKIVASEGAVEEGRPPARRLPEGLRRAFDSVQLLKAMGDQDPGQRPPPAPSPPVSPNSPPPPPPPGIQRAGERTRMAATGSRRRPPAWRIERGSPLAGGFGMEVAGVSGDRNAAWQWIESEDGRRWREGAVGLDLVLFSA